MPSSRLHQTYQTSTGAHDKFVSPEEKGVKLVRKKAKEELYSVKDIFRQMLPTFLWLPNIIKGDIID